MRDRKLRNNEEQNPQNTLRRSPRFLKAEVEYPQTPKPAERKTRPNSFSTPLASSIARTQKRGGGVLKSLTKSGKVSIRSARLNGAPSSICLDSPEQCAVEKRLTRSSTRGSRLVNNQLNNCGEISKKGNGEVAGSKCLDESSKGLSRSARLNGGANASGSVMEKRVTRSATRGSRLVNNQLNNCSEITKKGDKEDNESKCSDKSSKGPSKSARLKSRADVNKYVVEKRVTMSSRRVNKSVNNDIDSKNDSGERRVKALSERVKGTKVGFDLGEQSIGVVEKRITRSVARVKTTRSVELGISDEKKAEVDDELHAGKGNVKKVSIGEKRKRSHMVDDYDFIKGWTEEQELSLRRAYFTAKPTPQFWKKVARMVPGKSAEDCFNRIHADHSTPSQTRARSRPNKKQPPSPLPYSASKLLNTAGVNTKKPRARRKTLQAQKAVRHLLDKQRTEDKDYKADLFSILEPTSDILLPSRSLDFQDTTPFASPAPSRIGSSALLTRSLEISSSGHAKQFSRLNAAFVSPPVLKQVKNKALHERYIDQLHCRDAKRKACALRNAKSKRENDNTVIPVSVAKDALFFDAQDAIDKLRKMEPSANCEVDDEDEDVTSCEDEDGLF